LLENERPGKCLSASEEKMIARIKFSSISPLDASPRFFGSLTRISVVTL
jgi:hypothetical protein